MSLPSLRRVLIGKPLHSAAAPHQRLPKILALPVFASDNLSSVAYASQETMIALIAAGVGSTAFHLTVPISLAIIGLLVVIVISYNQTIHAYPNGGGSYIVARDNLGVVASEVAAAALLTDYVLTVAVSVSAGVDAVLSEYQNLNHLWIRLALNVAATLFIMLMNLRGVKESGATFALPTYSFVISILTLIGLGLFQVFTGGFHHLDLVPQKTFLATNALGTWVILKAFASGCTAITGVEAVSNGVPAFRPPESQNAVVTMRWMAAILGTSFLGTSFLAQRLAALHHISPSDSGETTISQIAHAVVGNSPFHAVVQWTTFLILVLAANTSFADFPRLCAIASRDRHLPRWFGVLGDRLVFQNGILVLAALSIALQLAFRGSTDALIPLYCIGVFLAVTLSQAGMVARWNRQRSPGWQWRVLVNGFGAVLTAVVTVVFAVVKFTGGAWVVLVLIPLLVFLLTRVDRHYEYIRSRLRLKDYHHPGPRPIEAIVLVGRWDGPTLAAVEYARLAFPTVKALHWSRDARGAADVQVAIQIHAAEIELSVDNRSSGWASAVRDEVERRRSADPNKHLVVVLPRSLDSGSGRFDRWAHWQLKWALLNEPGVVVADASTVALPQNAMKEENRSGVAAGRTSLHEAPDGRGESSGTRTVTARQRSLFDLERHRVLVLVPSMHRGILEALDFASQVGSDLRALHIEVEPEQTQELREAWEKYAGNLPLIIMESPYRQLREPLVRYVTTTRMQQRTEVLTVVLPEFVARKWWDKILHNQSGLLLKFALRGQPNVVVVNTRYFLD